MIKCMDEQYLIFYNINLIFYSNCVSMIATHYINFIEKYIEKKYIELNISVKCITVKYIASEARAPKASSRTAREDPSACVHENCRQCIKILKIENLGLISYILWKLWAFRHHRNFVNFVSEANEVPISCHIFIASTIFKPL